MRRALVGGWCGKLTVCFGLCSGLQQHLHAPFNHRQTSGLIGYNGVQIINHRLLVGDGFFKLGQAVFHNP